MREMSMHRSLVSGWLADFRNSADFGTAPESRQHFDVMSRALKPDQIPAG